jgi:hypothetical protein
MFANAVTFLLCRVADAFSSATQTLLEADGNKIKDRKQILHKIIVFCFIGFDMLDLS